jgi:site-specific DNA-methyltransferase (adenine-specific)
MTETNSGVFAVDSHDAPVADAKSARMRRTEIPEGRPYDGAATTHVLNLGDARNLDWIADKTVHLVVTSPPYFNLKKYNDHPSQLGDIDDYEVFLSELDKVWQHCFRVLVPGGRLVCNVGDVCIARRVNRGRHHVFPLHADISVRARKIGFDYLTPIIWHKIANANYEAGGGSGGFLGKPYEPNAIVKNDIEYVLMLRKHGAYRKPTEEQRAFSRLTKEEQEEWFRPIWGGLTGASTRSHPAPFPVEFAYRLVRMFSFTGDTVLDPFAGSGTTTIAAMKANRNSISNEVDPSYFEMATRRLRSEISERGLFALAPRLLIQKNGKHTQR